MQASASELLSKWNGESERSVRSLFEFARCCHPRVILFLDEIDALCAIRGSSGESEVGRRIKTEFLLQMNHVLHSLPDNSRQPGMVRSHHPDDRTTTTTSGNVVTEFFFVLAATNVPWDIDPAMRRRFEELVYVAVADDRERLGIITRELACAATHGETDDPACLCRGTNDLLKGCSQAEVVTVIGRARRLAAARCCVAAMKNGGRLPSFDFVTDVGLTWADLQAAKLQCPRTSSDSDLQRYDAWRLALT